MSAKNLNTILHAAFFTPLTDGSWGLPMHIWGNPGIGKTAGARQLARRYGIHCERLAPGERGEGAFGVTPVPEKDPHHGTVLEYPPHAWVKGLLRTNPKTGEVEEVGLVALDEANTAPPALKPALMAICNERTIGTHRFGPRVRVFAYANPVGIAAGGWDYTAPEANRYGHLDSEGHSAAEWSNFMMAGAGDAGAGDIEAEEARVLAAFPNALARAIGAVTAFIQRRPELLNKMPADGDPNQSRSWPSERTWEMATRAYASALVHKLDGPTRDEFVTAFIGASACGELMTFLEANDLPDPVELLDGKRQFQHDPERLDLSLAVLSSCTALVVPKTAEKREPRTTALWKIIEHVAADAKDVCLPGVQALSVAGLTDASKYPTARTVLSKIYGVLQAANAR